MKVPERDATPVMEMRPMQRIGCLVRENFWDLVCLNLICVLFSLPVVTFPVAWAALLSVLQRMVRGEAHGMFRDFWSAFTRLFWRALLAGLCVFTGPLLSLYGIPFYRSLANGNWLFAVPIAVMALFSLFQLLLGIYLFPLLDMVEQPFAVMLKNAALLAVIRLPKNVLTLLVPALLLLLSIAGLPLTLLIPLCFLFAGSGLVTATTAWFGVKEYVLPRDPESGETLRK